MDQREFDATLEDREYQKRQATNKSGVTSMVFDGIQQGTATPKVGRLMLAREGVIKPEEGLADPEADLAHDVERARAIAEAQYGTAAKYRAPAGGGEDLETYEAKRKIDAKYRAQPASARQSGGGAAGGSPDVSKYALETANRTIKAVDDVMPDINGWTAGWVGSALSNIPGTKAANVSAELSSVASNIAFNALQAMRDASKTGGALGQVSERELDLLSSVEGSIRQNQSPENLKLQLQKVRESMDRVRQAAGQGTQQPGTESTRQRWTKDANGRPVKVQ
jgi:hypothetical protein